MQRAGRCCPEFPSGYLPLLRTDDYPAQRCVKGEAAIPDHTPDETELKLYSNNPLSYQLTIIGSFQAAGVSAIYQCTGRPIRRPIGINKKMPS
jgi:hypothetical protein